MYVVSKDRATLIIELAPEPRAPMIASTHTGFVFIYIEPRVPSSVHMLALFIYILI